MASFLLSATTSGTATESLPEPGVTPVNGGSGAALVGAVVVSWAVAAAAAFKASTFTLMFSMKNDEVPLRGVSFPMSA